MKKCSKCLIEKDFSFFGKCKSSKDGMTTWCKGCFSEYNKQRWKEKREFLISQNREWRGQNREKANKSSRDWYQKTKEAKRQKRNEYQRERYNRDEEFRLRQNVSAIIRILLKRQKGEKNFKTWSTLLYTPQQLKEHLESQFEPWMTWNNYGPPSLIEKTWNIDHIVPQSSFKLTNKNEFLKCWSLENLRPMDAIQNIKKGNRL